MGDEGAGFPWMRTRDFAEGGGARLHVVYPAREQMPPPPEFVGGLRVDLLGRIDPHLPDLGVLEISGALVLGKHGWIVSRDGFLLPEQSWCGGEVERVRLPARLPAGTVLPGTSLSLASDFAGRSCGHYLLDSLSRMHLFLAAGVTLDAVDHVVCRRPPTAEAARHFSRLGVPADKCVWMADGTALRPERLLSPGFPGTKMNYPGWVPAYLKQAFGPSAATPHRRLWIGREGLRRTAINGADVRRTLAAHGFEAYDIAAAANPADDFAAAAMVVSPHAGALADLAFCAPGTRVLELLPSDHPAPYYYTLSLAAGLDYRCLVCRSLHERPGPLRSPSTSDFTVDIDELSAALSGMEGLQAADGGSVPGSLIRRM
jgi:capsular polysaccharide biosynthesis protein